MASNFTLSEDMYLNINTGISIGLFFFLNLPALVLYLVCVLGLIFAGGINRKIRVLLINLILPDVCIWVGVSALLLGYPTRQVGGDFSCRLFMTSISIGVSQKYSTIALFAIIVYIFLKYGIKKLKWRSIALPVVLSWTTATAFGMMPFFNIFGISETDGLCDREVTSPFHMFIISLRVGKSVLLFVIIAFTVLSYRQTKKMSLNGSVGVEKAMIMKYLLSLNISATLYFVISLVAASLSSLKASFKGEETLLGLTLVRCVRVFIQLPLVTTPVTAILILRPVRSALKEGYSKCFIDKEADEEELVDTTTDYTDM
jgi:hypothetical protein